MGRSRSAFKLFFRLAKLITILVWACAVALALYGWKTQRAVFAFNEQRELNFPNGSHRLATGEEIERAAGRRDGAIAHLRRFSADRWRESLAITVTSIKYMIDNPEALRPYYTDNGGSNLNPFYFHGEQLDRQYFRFPLSIDRSIVWDIVPKLPPPDYKPHYTFVRTNDSSRIGWDVEVRVPFWMIFGALALPMLSCVSIKGYRKIMCRHRRSHRRCQSCNYDLRASTDRCPECGHPIPETVSTTPNTTADTSRARTSPRTQK